MSELTTEGKGKGRAAEILEVEDEEDRQARMYDIFQRLDTSSGPRPAESFTKFDFGDRRTFPMGPPSELLSRVQAFLPEIAASNADIARQAEEDPNGVDIEHLEDSEQYIEMNLGLGVFETRKPPDGSVPMDTDADEDKSSDSSSTDSDSNSDSSGTSSGSSSEVDAEDDIEAVLPRPMKPLPKRRRPQIVVLNDS
ncbi:hypothetical protein BKA93DRAFT_790254 [Sparassis latifolia]